MSFWIHHQYTECTATSNKGLGWSKPTSPPTSGIFIGDIHPYRSIDHYSPPDHGQPPGIRGLTTTGLPLMATKLYRFDPPRERSHRASRLMTQGPLCTACLEGSPGQSGVFQPPGSHSPLDTGRTARQTRRVKEDQEKTVQRLS